MILFVGVDTDPRLEPQGPDKDPLLQKGRLGGRGGHSQSRC